MSVPIEKDMRSYEGPCPCVSRKMDRMSCTVMRLARFCLGMVPPCVVQDRENAVTAQAMTDRAPALPDLSGIY